MTADASTTLYRLYDSAGVLLYVGITDRHLTRHAEHATSKPWWLRVWAQPFRHWPTRADALREERWAIRNELPVYNITHAALGADDRRDLYESGSIAAILWAQQSARKTGRAAVPDESTRVAQLVAAQAGRRAAGLDSGGMTPSQRMIRMQPKVEMALQRHGMSIADLHGMTVAEVADLTGFDSGGRCRWPVGDARRVRDYVALTQQLDPVPDADRDAWPDDDEDENRR